jgi:hypothetical protein
MVAVTKRRCLNQVLWRIIGWVRVRFTQSARRHRIGKARVLHVIEHVEPTRVPADEEMRERLVWVGADDRGLELEVVAVAEPDFLLVIHVMPRQFRRRRTP